MYCKTCPLVNNNDNDNKVCKTCPLVNNNDNDNKVCTVKHVLWFERYFTKALKSLVVVMAYLKSASNV